MLLLLRQFGGEWQQIKDKFILAAGDTYQSGNTGGSSIRSLIIDNLPSHFHTYDKVNPTTENHTLTLAQIPSHRHTSVAGSTAPSPNGLKRDADCSYQGSVVVKTASSTTGNAGSSGAHNHRIKTTPANSRSVGSGTSFSIMPPYEVAYCWKRIS